MQYWRVRLPPGVRSPFDVYINGVPQELGVDYRISSGELLFERELVSQKLGAWAWFMGFWGIGRRSLRARRAADGRPRAGDHPAVLTTSRLTQGRSSFSADRIARVAGDRLSV